MINTKRVPWTFASKENINLWPFRGPFMAPCPHPLEILTLPDTFPLWPYPTLPPQIMFSTLVACGWLYYIVKVFLRSNLNALLIIKCLAEKYSVHSLSTSKNAYYWSKPSTLLTIHNIIILLCCKMYKCNFFF